MPFLNPFSKFDMKIEVFNIMLLNTFTNSCAVGYVTHKLAILYKNRQHGNNKDCTAVYFSVIIYGWTKKYGVFESRRWAPPVYQSPETDCDHLTR